MHETNIETSNTSSPQLQRASTRIVENSRLGREMKNKSKSEVANQNSVASAGLDSA